MISIVWYGNCPRQVQWNLNQSTVTNTSWWKLCLCTYNHHWNIRNVSLNLLPPRQWSSPYSQTKLEISLVKVWEFSLWALTFEVLIKTLQISTATNWMPLQSLLILSILKAKLLFLWVEVRLDFLRILLPSAATKKFRQEKINNNKNKMQQKRNEGTNGTLYSPNSPIKIFWAMHIAYGSRIVEELLIISKRIPKSSRSFGRKLFESSDNRIL